MSSDSKLPGAEKASKRKRRKWRIGLLVFVGPAMAVAGAFAGFTIWRRVGLPEDAPVVGVSLDTAWHSRIGVTNKTYEIALARVGARMYNIRPGDEAPEVILNQIDALFLTGGGDIATEIYGGKAGTAKLVDRERDEMEIALVRGALERDMPILGICRGIQILNVAHGGTVRNLREEGAVHDTHGVSLDSLRAHSVTITTGTRLAATMGCGEKLVNSFHAQAVGRVGNGLSASAQAPDGVVEALERADCRFVIATQWHPEILSLENSRELAVFEEFVRRAKEYHTSRP